MTGSIDAPGRWENADGDILDVVEAGDGRLMTASEDREHPIPVGEADTCGPFVRTSDTIPLDDLRLLGLPQASSESWWEDDHGRLVRFDPPVMIRYHGHTRRRAGAVRLDTAAGQREASSSGPYRQWLPEPPEGAHATTLRTTDRFGRPLAWHVIWRRLDVSYAQDPPRPMFAWDTPDEPPAYVDDDGIDGYMLRSRTGQGGGGPWYTASRTRSFLRLHGGEWWACPIEDETLL